MATLLLMMTAGVGDAWGQLTGDLTVSGYEGYNKTFYDFKTNTPAVLPTSGDLRYREDFGLYNFGSGTRSATIAIPVAAGDLLVLQEYNAAYPTTINHGTKNDALSGTVGYPCFNIAEDADNITFTTPRYGGVVAVLVFSQKYFYTVNASNGSDILKTLATGLVPMGEAVTIAYPQYLLSGNTLYNIANNGSGDWFRKTFTPNTNLYTETLYYTNGTVSNVIYYQEAEEVPGCQQATNDARASQGKMGYTGSTSAYVNTTYLNSGAYRIAWRGVNGNSQTRQVRFKSGETEVYSFGIANGTNLLGSSGNIKISDPGMLSFSCEGSSQSGLDWLYVQAVFAYKEAGSTITVGTTDYRPDMVLPDYNESAYTFTSDNQGVATVDWYGIDAHHNGTATITARRIIDGVEYTTTHTVTVTGETPATTAFNYNASTKTETYEITGSGRLPEYDDGTTINIGYGSTEEVQIADNNNAAYCIDKWGYWHAHLSAGSTGTPDMGTYYILRPKLGYHGKLSVYGYVSDESGTRNAIRLVDENGTVLERNTAISDTWATYTFNQELIGGKTYYLFAETGSMDGRLNNAYSILFLHAFSLVESNYYNTSEVIEIPASGQYTIPNGTGLTNPTYTIENRYGELAADVTIDGNVLRNITAGGAVRIGITAAGYTAYHLLTVAYPATDYPGHLWDFNIEGAPMTTAEVLRTVPVPNNTALGNSGDTWTALYKVHEGSYTRAPEWRLNRAIHGDNVLVVPESDGLLFNTATQGFYMRNDDESFRHLGIHSVGASFTIPLLKAGDIVELNWKHDAANSGSVFTATNLKDLRNKPVSEQFLITESAHRTQFNHPGRYSFIVAADGDVSFTLQDAGYTDILSIRIYKGPYRSTMLNINAEGNVTAETTMLLDNAEQEYSFNYCNQLYSTATGPAFYVLKGWRKGIDPNENVTGSDAAKSPTTFIDNDDTYPAYPVSAEESNKLYELRKNIQGLRMYNHVWQSQNNSYSFGRIKATGGWGKVTIRMNNYTNDMKYLIGYTPDYTLTVGSAPHQTYPYTWDFTNISAQAERGKATNAYHSIIDHDQFDTNWSNTANGVFSLNIDNLGQYDSQYVPGAVLVTTDRSLSKIKNMPGSAGDIYALDELDGLGVNGKIAFDSDSKPVAAPSKTQAQRRAGGSISLLTFSMDHYKEVKSTEVVDGETIVTAWTMNTDNYLAAGNGWVKFGADRITETTVAACGFAYKCDYNVTNYDKGIYLRPARKLKNGDVISVNIYATSSPSGSDYGLCIYPEYGSTPSATLFLGDKVKNTETTLEYTVTAGDGLADQSMIMLFRNTDKSVFLSEVHITGSASSEPVRREIFCETQTTLTIPDLNADGKQDWIYVSASEAPIDVVNATLVDSGDDGADANQDHDVYKYKVTAAGNAYLTFPMNARIYKIGVTHILKEIHTVNQVGWATESRNHAIDHELTGYLTMNDVNAYTVSYDSYDLTTATVALTPVHEDGYVPMNTGIVLRLDQTTNLDKANNGRYVPLFYPSYTREQTSTAVDFPDNNMMYPNLNEATHQYENAWLNSITYTKFILTNVHWKYTRTEDSGTWSGQMTETDAAGFYRMHIWGDSRDKMPANTAYLLIPTDNLPIAVWNNPTPASTPSVNNSIGIRDTADTSGLEITTTNYTNYTNDDGAWYDIQGRRIANSPTSSARSFLQVGEWPKAKGLYIHRGRKVVVTSR